MNLELALLGMEVESIPTSPQASGSVRLDTFFELEDFAIEEAEASSADDAEVILMHLPLGKRVTVSKRRIQACKTPSELRELDKTLYRSAGLDPASFGL